jgi:hypothetical protein
VQLRRELRYCAARNVNASDPDHSITPLMAEVSA